MARKRKTVAPSIAERLAAIEAGLERDREERESANDDRKQLLVEIRDLHSSVNGIQQTLSSAQAVLSAVTSLKNYGEMEAEYLFWKRFLGSGFTFLWRITALIVSSGLISAAFTRWVLR